MIIVRLSGGLGNQLFQYAFGRSLSYTKNTELKLDTHFFGRGIEKNRSFALRHFNIQAEIADASDFEQLGIPHPARTDTLSKIKRNGVRLMDLLKSRENRRMVIEPHYAHSPEILKCGTDCYFSGIWQSEKYFKNIEHILRKELVLIGDKSEAYRGWQKQISETISVSIHIRRGDYAQQTKLGMRGTDYYERAIREIAKTVSKPTFFIFSDDIAWAKANIKTGFETHTVSGSGVTDAEELILMAACKHNIIANSTFSWWGAWLNQNQNKIVVAPQVWFADRNIPTKDLLPEKWLQL